MEFPAVGGRDNNSSGSLTNTGVYGTYWSSVAKGSYNAYYMSFSNSANGVFSSSSRQTANSVRCVR
ncbi:MAG: hypothetical protein K2N21_04570 [Rikenellaceae bacterium]|nr:hypothetical protein [Rikenellaceae bacterium]